MIQRATATQRKRAIRSSSGKTARKYHRHKIVHNYKDHAFDKEQIDLHVNDRYNYHCSFPMKLHELLEYVEADGMEHIVSWRPHGRCFQIHKKDEFVKLILPRYYRQTHMTSFQRQLNLYGFNRLTHGKDEGSYYHEYFLRGQPTLCKSMVRTKVKGTYCKGANNPDDEPNFYSLPFMMKDGTIQGTNPSPDTSSLRSDSGTYPDNVTQHGDIGLIPMDDEKVEEKSLPYCNTSATSEMMLSMDPSDCNWNVDNNDDDYDDIVLLCMEMNHNVENCEPLIANIEPAECYSSEDAICSDEITLMMERLLDD